VPLYPPQIPRDLTRAVVDRSPLLLRPFIGLLYQHWMIDDDDCGAVGGMNEWQGKPKYWEETCPSAALSTTDPHDLTRAVVEPSPLLLRPFIYWLIVPTLDDRW
jgi:hypothetical protein